MVQKIEKSDNKLTISEQIKEPSMEQLMQAYRQVEERESEARWAKGQLLYALLSDKTLSQKWLCARLGVSPSEIQELVNVYRMFPDERTRVPSLSWHHHQIATNSSDPARYMAMANGENLSIWELREKVWIEQRRVPINPGKNDERKKKAELLLKDIENIIAKVEGPAHWFYDQLQALIYAEKKGVSKWYSEKVKI